MTKAGRQNPKAFEHLNVALKALEGMQEKVGFFESAKYEDGTPVAYIAAIQELGYAAGGIPPRPFMRPTAKKMKAKWSNIMQRGSKAVLAGKITVEQVYEQLGLVAAADVAKSITEIYSPALKYSTIRARMRRKADKKTVGNLTKPLIDTGLMLSSVTNVTEKAK